MMIKKIKAYKECHTYEACCQFYRRIKHGDSRPAMPASSPQYQITQNGNIVIELYPVPAGRAARRRGYDGFFNGYSVDTHIKKTANRQAEQQSKYKLYIKREHMFVYN
jgi:hypothetical protein